MRRLLSMALVFSACAAPPAARARVDASPDAVLAASRRLLADWPVDEETSARLRTGWRERDSDAPPQGLLLGTPDRERVRYTIEVAPADAGTEVAVRAVVERRAPGGTRARQWARVSGDAAARDLLERIRAGAAP